MYGALTNCLVVNNQTKYDGAGSYYCTVSGCALNANISFNRGGGIVGGTAVNCTLVHNSAYYDGGGALSATLISCTLYNNQAGNGGGAYYCTLTNCVLDINVASFMGAGAHSSSLANCVLTRNWTSGDPNSSGGGAYKSTLTSCLLTGNTSRFGGGAGSCTLKGCLLEGNIAGFGGYNYPAGGGADSSTLDYCILRANQATSGGGAKDCTLNNCLLVGNSASSGGGAYRGNLSNCTLATNSATVGGGVYNASVFNSIVYFNTAASDGSNSYSSVLNFCCTTPMPSSGIGNIANDPAFMDLAGLNLRLQSNSPCINAGNNSYVTNLTDLDGRPRIFTGNVDIGAYEFQSDTLNRFLFWLQQNGLATDGSADFVDADADGLNNWQEWIAGTNPTNSASALRMLNPVRNGANLVVSWQSVTNQVYSLQRSSSLSASPPFLLLAANIPGQPGVTCYTDTNTAASDAFFYRVGVQSGLSLVPPPSSIISFAWLQQYGLPTDGSADFADTDGDGLNNWQEWRAGTDPTNAQSALRMVSAVPGPLGVNISWQSVSGRLYFVQRAANIGGALGFQTLQSNIAGGTNTTTWFDANAGGGPFFYRVGVQ